ncbi:MAG: hypothetical protein IPF92_05185 [Myxococcales bacterium]|nr:hypothetical protein [Myxococcales bacterium]MBL0197962.1 hypothetical protein [Myxococcales bacterium]
MCGADGESKDEAMSDARNKATWTLEEQARAPRELVDQTSGERFDRIAFAARAVALLGPRNTRVAVAPARRMLLESGRAWGRGEGARWATLYVPPDASRRAIAVAVVALGGAPHTPYAIDILMNADLL